jgi:glycosyltransferase involved in cell wall biosynthesis
VIKVLNILTDSNIGGAGRCLINYLKNCRREIYDIAVVLPENSLLEPEVTALGFRVIPVAGIAEKSFSMKAIGTLKQVIRQENPQIVHTHGSLSGRIAGRQCGAKVVYTRHSAFPVPSYLQKGLGHWMNGLVNSHYADRIIAVSPACQQNLLDSGVPAEKITVMMNGVDPVPRAAAERCQALRQELQIPPKVFTAGILARLEPYKGHQTLLEAARLLKEEDRDFRILIGGSGPEEAHIRDSIRELDLTDRVLFLGFVNNVSEVLSLLDVQLNCSYGTEASSLALIEGMSLGLATVASDYGGNPWQVEDGETGLLFPARDSAALAQRLGRLMDDPDLLRRLQASARTSYETRYTGEIFAHNIESVYQQILEK